MLLTKQERAKQSAARKKQQQEKPCQKKKQKARQVRKNKRDNEQLKDKTGAGKLRPSRFARSCLKNKPSLQNKPSLKSKPCRLRHKAQQQASGSSQCNAWTTLTKAVTKLSEYATSKGINSKSRKRASRSTATDEPEQQTRYKKIRAEHQEAQKMLENAAEFVVVAKATADQLALDVERTEKREVAFLEAQDQAEKNKVKNTKEGKELGAKLAKCNELLQEAENLTGGKQVLLHSFLEAC